MDIKEIIKFAGEAEAALKKHMSPMEGSTHAFITMLKIHKKAGHLSGEVMKSFGFSSKEHAKEPMQLDNLMAGLVLKAFMLAVELDVDMNAALERKIAAAREKIETEWQ